MTPKSILFVDDEEKVLKSLKRMFHGHSRDWEVFFARSGQEALNTFKIHPIQILVTDMKMANMSGIDLMGIVKKKYPQTIRIVLSGHSSRIDVIKSASLAHKYLAKPFHFHQLVSVISQCYHSVRILRERRVKALFNTDELPTLPAAYYLLIDLLKKVEPKENEVCKTISNDKELSANILTLVNSIYFEQEKEISTITDAVHILGGDIIQALMLSSHVHNTIRKTPLLHIDELQKRSLLAGQLAKIIGEHVSLDQVEKNSGIIASILQDMGTLIVVNNLSKQYISILTALKQNTDSNMLKEEYNKLGVSHTEIGSFVLGHWGLSDDIITAVALHHKPRKLAHYNNTVIGITYLTNVFLEHFEQEEDPKFPNLQYDTKYCKEIDITLHIPRCYAQCLQAYKKIHSVDVI